LAIARHFARCRMVNTAFRFVLPQRSTSISLAVHPSRIISWF